MSKRDRINVAHSLLTVAIVSSAGILKGVCNDGVKLNPSRSSQIKLLKRHQKKMYALLALGIGNHGPRHREST